MDAIKLSKAAFSNLPLGLIFVLKTSWKKCSFLYEVFQKQHFSQYRETFLPQAQKNSIIESLGKKISVIDITTQITLL